MRLQEFRGTRTWEYFPHVEPGLSEYAVEAFEKQILNLGVYAKDFRDDSHFCTVVTYEWDTVNHPRMFSSIERGYHHKPQSYVEYISWPDSLYGE